MQGGMRHTFRVRLRSPLATAKLCAGQVATQTRVDKGQRWALTARAPYMRQAATPLGKGKTTHSAFASSTSRRPPGAQMLCTLQNERTRRGRMTHE